MEFPALHRFNNDVEVEMRLFEIFLRELEEMELTEKVLGTFSGLMADHMAREECYYLYKLAESTKGDFPDCDPGKPRSQYPFQENIEIPNCLPSCIKNKLHLILLG